MNEESLNENAASSSQVDLSGLSAESRLRLHRILYRQERRVWLLALGLCLGVVLLLSDFHRSYPSFTQYSAIAVSVVLAFWVGYPAQRLLAQLRSEADTETQATIERKFDNSWQSVWDFVPPVFLPLLPCLGLLMYKLYLAL